MFRKLIMILLTACLVASMSSCAQKYYNVDNLDGEMVSVESAGLNRKQKNILKQYEKEEMELFQVIESGEFTAEQLAEFGLIHMDAISGEPVLDSGRYVGLPDVDPNLLIKVISGNATAGDIQKLYDAGLTEEQMQDLMPDNSTKTVDDDGNVLPPSD